MTCPNCAGLGYVDYGDPEDGIVVECTQCVGEGEIPDA